MNIIKTLAKSIREFKKEALLTPVFVCFEVVLECLIPLVMASLIDEMTGESMQPIIKYGSVLIVLALLSLLAGSMSGLYAATASVGFAKNPRQDIFFKIEGFAFSDIDRFKTSSLVTRLTTDVTNVQNAWQMLLRVAIRTPLMLVFSFVMAMTLNVKLSLIFLALVPILGAALFAIIFITMPIFRRIFKKYDAMNNSVQENVSGIRVVKSFVREDYENEKFEQASETVRQDFTMAEKILALNTPIMTFAIYAAILLVSYFGAHMIITSGGTQFTTGELSSLIAYGVQILAAMMIELIMVRIGRYICIITIYLCFCHEFYHIP